MFYNTVIEDIVRKASKDFDFFDRRERLKVEGLKVKPIVIEYDFDVFKDRNQNRRLIEILRKATFSSLSVFHANPYLHASFVDYKDGSSYDLWVLSNNRITIVPQMRSTYASLERLCNHIFIGFREGTIKDFGEIGNG